MEVLYNQRIDNSIIDDLTVKVEWGEYAVRTRLGIFWDPIIITDNNTQIVGGVFKKESSDLNSFYFKTPQHEILINGFDYPRQFINVEFCMVDSAGMYLDPAGSISEADISAFDGCIIILMSEQFLYVIRDSDGLAVKQFDRVGNTKYSGYPQFEVSPDGSKLCVNEGEYGELLNFQYLDFNSDPIVQRKYSERIKIDTFDSSGYPHLYFSLNHSKESIIAYKYSKENLSPISLKNEFEDDDSINVDVSIPSNNLEAIGILGKIATRRIDNYLIYGISPRNIIIAYMKAPGYKDLERITSDVYIKTCKHIFTKIMKAHKLNEIETAIYIYRNYCKYYYDDSLAIAYDALISSDRRKEYTKKYNEIYEQMILNGQVQAKWKSEADMYTIIKKHFTDAIYQYHDFELLGYQSFDVYVPSKQIAFEYQGIQHYEGVDYFGGEAGLKKRKELDIRKKNICAENGITLVEWRYDEPVSVITLEEKLAPIGIHFEK